MVKTENSTDAERFTNVQKSRLIKFKTLDIVRSNRLIPKEDILELVQKLMQLTCLVYYGDVVSKTKQASFTGIIEKVISLNEREIKCDCCRNVACGEIHVLYSKEVLRENLNYEDISFNLKVLNKTFECKPSTGQNRFVLLTCDSQFVNELKESLENYERLLEDVNRKFKKDSQEKCLTILVFKDSDDTAKVLVEPSKDVGFYPQSESGGDEDTFQAVTISLGKYDEYREDVFNVRLKGNPSSCEKTSIDNERENLTSQETRSSVSGTNDVFRRCSKASCELDTIKSESDDELSECNQFDDKEMDHFSIALVSHETRDIDEIQTHKEVIELKNIHSYSIISSVVLQEKPFNNKVKVAEKPKNKIQIWCSFGISTVATLVTVVAIIVVTKQKEHVSYQEKVPSSTHRNNASILNDPDVLLLNKGIEALSLHRKLKIKKEPVSAHTSLAVPPRIPGSENKPEPFFKKDYNVCVRINTISSPRYHARGVNVDIDGLIILYSGLYFVYSSVALKPNSTAYSATFPYQTWFQYIYKLRPNSPAHSTVLTRVVHTCCLNCTDSHYTAYSGGVFHLLSGDKIQVCLTGQGLLDFNDTTTYLGLFMISGTTKP